MRPSEYRCLQHLVLSDVVRIAESSGIGGGSCLCTKQFCSREERHDLGKGGVLTLFQRASRVLEGALRVGFCTSAFRQKPQTEAASTTSSLSCKRAHPPRRASMSEP